MDIQSTSLDGLVVLKPEKHEDPRGFFMEVFHHEKLKQKGIDFSVKQINQSHSHRGVIRGLHLQWDKPLAKIIRVVKGAIVSVAVDIRKKSPTFGQWVGIELDDKEQHLLYAPFGFAMGFCATEDADVEYLYSAEYNALGEGSILWNDPTLAIAWPIADPVVSARDQAATPFAAWVERGESNLF